MQDPSHGVHDERKYRVESEEGQDGQVEQRSAADLVGEPVVADHEQRRRRQYCVYLGGKRRGKKKKKRKRKNEKKTGKKYEVLIF